MNVMNDMANLNLTNSEAFTENGLTKFTGGVEFPNLGNLRLGEFAVSILGSASIVLSALSNHVSRIIGMRSKEQVVVVYTTSDIAFVQDQSIAGDRTNINLVTKSVRQLKSFTDPKPAIAVMNFMGSPKPAFGGL